MHTERECPVCKGTSIVRIGNWKGSEAPCPCMLAGEFIEGGRKMSLIPVEIQMRSRSVEESFVEIASYINAGYKIDSIKPADKYEDIYLVLIQSKEAETCQTK